MSSSVQLTTPSGFVDMDMVRRLEAAEVLPNVDFIPAHAHLHPEFGSAMEQIAGGYAFYAGPGSPVNHGVGMGLNGPVTHEEFERFEAFYRVRNVPAEIVMSPYADPSLREHTNSRGYKLTEFNSVLCQRLSADMRFPDPPAGVTIRRVEKENGRTWTDILVQGFADLGPLSPELFEGFARLESSVPVLAYIDGNAVGGGNLSIFRQQRLAGLFGAATLPEYRRRGVQTAMTYARLRMAADAGCDLAVVMTTPGSGSQRNAERQGFHVAYTKVVLVREWEGKMAGHP